MQLNFTICKKIQKLNFPSKDQKFQIFISLSVRKKLKINFSTTLKFFDNNNNRNYSFNVISTKIFCIVLVKTIITILVMCKEFQNLIYLAWFTRYTLIWKFPKIFFIFGQLNVTTESSAIGKTLASTRKLKNYSVMYFKPLNTFVIIDDIMKIMFCVLTIQTKHFTGK